MKLLIRCETEVFKRHQELRAENVEVYGIKKATIWTDTQLTTSWLTTKSNCQKDWPSRSAHRREFDISEDEQKAMDQWQLN